MPVGYNLYKHHLKQNFGGNMKLIHCADLHLDSKMESHLTKNQAAQRREELLNTFFDMITYGKEQGVSVILIAGDMFDTSKNTQKRIKARVLEQIKAHAEIDFLYLRGNHDQDDFFFDLKERGLAPDNLKLFSDQWLEYCYGHVSIRGCEMNRETASRLYSDFVLNKEQVNILMLHGQESLYDKKQDAELIHLKALQNRYIDYLALGHIHSYKYDKLDHRGAYCYSGCLEGRGFDECGQKGFVLLEVNGSQIAHQFIPFAKRTLHEVAVELSGYLTEVEIRQKMEAAIETFPEKDLLKIILTGDIDEETDIDVKYLHRIFQDRFYFLKVVDKTQLRIAFSSYAKDISLKGEFIRQVQAADLDDNLKDEIMLLGIKALAGREIE